ncbi:MAG: GNAT family N-acetyltransferase [Oscillospiraceae bacterium]|nr:GNAT family N-acetyltransferase [Oscillospiraceae bacterium]
MDDVNLFGIRYASEGDESFWFELDNHLDEREFRLKVRDKRGYVISDNEKPIGIMRYNLFWDNMPFLTLIFLEEAYRGRGFGRQSMLFWEDEMRSLGYKVVMTSTQIDEQAQHFYRRLGYVERGSLSLDNTPIEQAQEIFMLKVL